MIWLDELWLEPTKEELDKIELEMGIDYLEEKLTATVKGDNISLHFNDGPKETYPLSDLWLDELWLELEKIELEMGVDHYGKINSNS